MLCADLLQITIWLTPAGTVDNGGLEQPAYLNFDVALLGPPAGNQMEVRVPPPQSIKRTCLCYPLVLSRTIGRSWSRSPALLQRPGGCRKRYLCKLCSTKAAVWTLQQSAESVHGSQDLKHDSAAQGIIGETYNRMLAGEEALSNPESKYYLADDYVFHGKGAEVDYALDSYFQETVNSMFGKVSCATTCHMVQRPIVSHLTLCHMLELGLHIVVLLQLPCLPAPP